MKSTLYQKIPPAQTPFCIVSIGDTQYSDDDIISVAISYGGAAHDLNVPTATVEIYGSLPLKYNATFNISYNLASGANRIRFTGRVGQQTIKDNAFYTTTTIIATSQSVQLLRSGRKINIPNQSSLAYITVRIAEEISRKGITNLAVSRSKALSMDRFPKSVDLTVKEMVEISTKNAVVIAHKRNGTLSFTHPVDKISQTLETADSIPSVLRSQAIAPAEYDQPVSYIDTGVRALVNYQGDLGVYNADFTDEFLQDIANPPEDREILDMTDISYQKETGNWRYGLRVATYRKIWLAYQINAIEVDMLEIMNGSEYDRIVYRYITGINEADLLSLGGDWQPFLQGIKSIIGYKETLTADKWVITFDLLDPRLHYGFSKWATPLPELPIYVWEQGNKAWESTERAWG